MEKKEVERNWLKEKVCLVRQPEVHRFDARVVQINEMGGGGVKGEAHEGEYLPCRH